MKKLIIGIFIGAALASAVFYFLYRKDENEHRENVKNLLELMQQKQKNEELTQSTINDPGSLVMTRTALSILISPGNEYYYFHGSDCSKIQKAGADKLQTLLLDEKARTNTKDLMILIKEIPGTPIKSAMDLLDMISMAKIPPGHFTSVDVSEKEKTCLQLYKKD